MVAGFCPDPLALGSSALPKLPIAGFEGPLCSREGKEEGDGVRKEKKGRRGRRKEGKRGKGFALADFMGSKRAIVP